MSIRTKRGGHTSLGFQQLSTLSSAKKLTPPDGAQFARIQCETQAVRWRDDGNNPTAGTGMPLPVGTELIYDGNLSAIMFIEQVASAKLWVTYYG